MACRWRLKGINVSRACRRYRLLINLGAIEFGAGEDIARIKNLDSAATTEQRFVYDRTNRYDDGFGHGDGYTTHVEGTWTAGRWLNSPTWILGKRWFAKTSRAFFTSPAIAGPLVLVTIWNFIFPFLTVLTTFFLGLFTAMLFNDLPGNNDHPFPVDHSLYHSQSGHHSCLARNV